MNKILETTKYVEENSKFVKINQNALAAFSRQLDCGNAQHWLSNIPIGFPKYSQEEKLNFLLLFNAISFSFWGEPNWTTEHEGTKSNGALGMVMALDNAISGGTQILSFDFCSKISREEFASIFQSDAVIPLLDERWKIVRDLGSKIMTRFAGKASGLVEESEGDAQKLVSLLQIYFSSFSDSSGYKGREVFFSKRAQLLVSDIYRLFDGKGYGELKYIDQLTACADYKLPRLLRRYGILEYATELSDRVDQLIEIPHGSEEEVEIRANTIWVIEYLKKELLTRFPTVTSMEINDYIWLASQEKILNEKPYHRTRTIAY